MGLELRILLLSMTALAAAGAPGGAAAAPAPAAPPPSSPPAMPDMPGMGAPGAPGAEGQGGQGGQGSPPGGQEMQGGGQGMQGMQGMQDTPGMHGMGAMHGMHGMRGLLGPYGMSRESSGTSWQPESAPHEALFTQRGPWSLMLHGQIFAIYDDQEGKRGGSKWFSENHVMGIAARQLGPGRLGLRAMLSAEPWTIGRNGYPLLLQTGETADGRTELVDRQHPHDLFNELAAVYSLPLWRDSSLYLYAGLPGEPALGPPTYMHRFSALDNPQTPLSHHWLDSTPISYRVTTLGWVLRGLKLHGSAFRGREPDQHPANH